MTHAFLSTKCQIVIPKELRIQIGLKPGSRMTLIPEGSIIHLVPARSLASLKGVVSVTDPLAGYRDKSDRP